MRLAAHRRDEVQRGAARDIERLARPRADLVGDEARAADPDVRATREDRAAGVVRQVAGEDRARDLRRRFAGQEEPAAAAVADGIRVQDQRVVQGQRDERAVDGAALASPGREALPDVAGVEHGAADLHREAVAVQRATRGVPAEAIEILLVADGQDAAAGVADRAAARMAALQQRARHRQPGRRRAAAARGRAAGEHAERPADRFGAAGDRAAVALERRTGDVDDRPEAIDGTAELRLVVDEARAAHAQDGLILDVDRAAGGRSGRRAARLRRDGVRLERRAGDRDAGVRRRRGRGGGADGIDRAAHPAGLVTLEESVRHLQRPVDHADRAAVGRRIMIGRVDAIGDEGAPHHLHVGRADHHGAAGDGRAVAAEAAADEAGIGAVSDLDAAAVGAGGPGVVLEAAADEAGRRLVDGDPGRRRRRPAATVAEDQALEDDQPTARARGVAQHEHRMLAAAVEDRGAARGGAKGEALPRVGDPEAGHRCRVGARRELDDAPVRDLPQGLRESGNILGHPQQRPARRGGVHGGGDLGGGLGRRRRLRPPGRGARGRQGQQEEDLRSADHGNTDHDDPRPPSASKNAHLVPLVPFVPLMPLKSSTTSTHQPSTINHVTLGRGSVSLGVPLGEGPRLRGWRTLAPRPKGRRGRLTH